MLAFNQFTIGLVDFIEKEIISQLNGITKFIGYASVYTISQEAEQIYKSFSANPMVTQLGIINDNGHIDIDKLYHAVKYAISKTKTIELYGVTLSANGLDNLYQYLKKQETM